MWVFDNITTRERQATGTVADTKNAADIVNILSVCNTVTEYTGTNLTYLGYALPGNATSVTKWIIFKFTYDANGNFLTKYAADGELIFNKEWDERASYTYTAAGS